MVIGPKIVDDGLVFSLDAGAPRSYPGSGTTWYNITSVPDGDFTLAGGLALTSSYNNGLAFDGTDDYGYGSGTFVEENFINNQSVTVEAFIDVTGYPSGNTGLYSNQRYYTEGNPGGFGVNIQSNGSSYIRYVFMMTSEDGGTKVSYQNILNENITFNQPHHICYTYDGIGKTVTSYRDGESSQTITNSNYYWTTSSASPAPVVPRIANSSQGGWGNRLPAIYYSLRVYGKALTADQVATNFNAHKKRYKL